MTKPKIKFFFNTGPSFTGYLKKRKKQNLYGLFKKRFKKAPPWGGAGHGLPPGGHGLNVSVNYSPDKVPIKRCTNRNRCDTIKICSLQT
jgi:hypothetical protein